VPCRLRLAPESPAAAFAVAVIALELSAARAVVVALP
jgi:hypothetical protein